MQTALGRSVARTIAYSPPEVVGKPKGQVWIGPHSDVYGFGKLCCFALTGRPDPDGGDRVILSEPWKLLLDDLTGWTIGRRTPHLGVVIDRLSRLARRQRAHQPIERDMYESTIPDHTAALAADRNDFSRWSIAATPTSVRATLSRPSPTSRWRCKLQPDDASLYRRRGLAHARMQAHDKADRRFHRGVSLRAAQPRGPRQPRPGSCPAQEYDQAIADYTEAIHLNPRDEALYYNRGNAHCCKADYEPAIADYTEAVRLDPRNAWAFGNRGKTHAMRGDLAKAIADFTRVLHLDPKNVRARWDRAQSYAQLGQYDKALADYDAAVQPGAISGTVA